jgi:hypothetical protein
LYKFLFIVYLAITEARRPCLIQNENPNGVGMELIKEVRMKKLYLLPLFSITLPLSLQSANIIFDLGGVLFDTSYSSA